MLRQILAMSQEHRHACAVFALIKYLVGNVIVGFEVDFRSEQRSTFAVCEIVPVNCARLSVTDIGIKRLVVFPFTGESGGAAETGQLNFANWLSVEREHAYEGARV